VTAQGILIWSIAHGAEDGRFPLGSKGEAPVGGLEDKIPQKLKQFTDIVYRFWLQKPPEFENFAQFTSWFLD